MTGKAGAKVRNCCHCQELEWVDGDEGDPSGWVCSGRQHRSLNEELAHEDRLQDKQYRERPKRCCKPQETNESS